MKVFYSIMSGIMLGITVVFGLWAFNEATKTCSHSWVWLVEVWAAVFALITISLFILKKKILLLSTAKGLLAIATIILGGCALGDTLYVIDLCNGDYNGYFLVKQVILCAILWIATIISGYCSFKKKD
mgnify:CR=1 FL=1